MNAHKLISLANTAFAEGALQQGLIHLRAFSNTEFADAGSWNRLAIVEEQIGDKQRAGDAHYNCIQAAPHIAQSYVFAGYWLEMNNQLDAAAAAYSLAFEAQPSSLDYNAAASDGVNVRARAGNSLMRKHLSEHHQLAQHSVTKVSEALWTRTHNSTAKFASKQFAPELFFIPTIRQQKYYRSQEFGWAEGLEASFEAISTELKQVLQNSDGKQQLRPYLGEKTISQGPLMALAGSRKWSALDIYRDGQINPLADQQFPNTLAALSNIDTYGLNENPNEVFFSILEPGQSIAPHFGQSNHALTVHLGIDIPENCFLNVSSEQRSWGSGKLLIFDDSFIHSAHNNSQHTRIVLLFSVWHPDLDANDRRAIQNSFIARENWMRSRQDKLEALKQT